MYGNCKMFLMILSGFFQNVYNEFRVLRNKIVCYALINEIVESNLALKLFRNVIKCKPIDFKTMNTFYQEKEMVYYTMS